jgi:hypothetical protein
MPVHGPENYVHFWSQKPNGLKGQQQDFLGNLYFSKIYVSCQIFENYIIIIGAIVPALGIVHNRHMTWRPPTAVS